MSGISSERHIFLPCNIFCFTEEVQIAVIAGASAGGVLVIVIIVAACVIYRRCKHSDNGKICWILTLLHSAWPKLYGVLAVLSATGLMQKVIELKVNGYKFKRGNTDIFIISFLSEWGQLLKERICS